MLDVSRAHPNHACLSDTSSITHSSHIDVEQLEQENETNGQKTKRNCQNVELVVGDHFVVVV